MNIPQQLPFSNPENIVSAAPGAVFRRDGNRFSLEYRNTITELNLSKKAFANNYRDQFWFDSLREETISFEKARESWIKTGTDTGKTGWEFISNKNQSLNSTNLEDDIFILSTNNGKYVSNATSSYALKIYYTGSYYSGSADTFLVQMSSSNNLWYYSGSALLKPIAGTLSSEPTLGVSSSIASPWEFEWTSTVATSSRFEFVANFKFDGSASVSGSVDINARMYLKSGFGASPVLVNGASITLIKST